MEDNIILTKTQQIQKLDELPTYDRSLVDYSLYNKNVGHAGVKYSMTVQVQEDVHIDVFIVMFIKLPCTIIEDLLIVFMKK